MRQSFPWVAAGLLFAAPLHADPRSAGVGAPPPVGQSAAEDAIPEQEQISPDEIGEGWIEQSGAYDVIASYDIHGLEVPVRVGVARRWYDDGVRVLLFVIDPPQLDEVAFQWTRDPRKNDDVVLYYTPQLELLMGEIVTLRSRKVGRLPLGFPKLDAGTVDSLMLETFRPYLPGELVFERLPDEVIDGEPCRVVVARPAEGRVLEFDRMELAISRRTGTPLRTVYYSGDKETRRLVTAPGDVAEYGGRYLPTKRTLTTGDGTRVEIVLATHDTETEVNRRYFSRQSLENQHFPKLK